MNTLKMHRQQFIPCKAKAGPMTAFNRFRRKGYKLLKTLCHALNAEFFPLLERYDTLGANFIKEKERALGGRAAKNMEKVASRASEIASQRYGTNPQEGTGGGGGQSGDQRKDQEGTDNPIT